MSLADLHIEMELGSPESNSCLVARGLGLSSLACASVCEELLLDRASVISLAPLAERFVLFVHRRAKLRTNAVEALMKFAPRPLLASPLTPRQLDGEVTLRIQQMPGTDHNASD